MAAFWNLVVVLTIQKNVGKEVLWVVVLREGKHWRIIQKLAIKCQKACGPLQNVLHTSRAAGRHINRLTSNIIFKNEKNVKHFCSFTFKQGVDKHSIFQIKSRV